jgi:hypothetical protein
MANATQLWVAAGEQLDTISKLIGGPERLVTEGDESYRKRVYAHAVGQQYHGASLAPYAPRMLELLRRLDATVKTDNDKSSVDLRDVMPVIRDTHEFLQQLDKS